MVVFRKKLPILMNSIPEKYPGQRFLLLPDQTQDHALRLPLCRDLLATDLGHFPEAVGHRVHRPEGCPNHIVIFCVAGEGWCRISGQRLNVPASHLLLIPAGVPHAYGAAAGMPWRVYWVHITGARADEHVQYLRGESQQAIRRVTGLTEICEGFERLWRCRDEGGSEPALMRMSVALCELIVTLHARLRIGDAAPGTEARIARALEHMRSGLGERLQLSDFAHMAGVSVPHFCALFRAQTGVPPMLYFNRLRMRQAAEWLDGSTLRISEIARRVGYENPFHFSRAFRRVHGLSPRDYRKRLRG